MVSLINVAGLTKRLWIILLDMEGSVAVVHCAEKANDGEVLSIFAREFRIRVLRQSFHFVGKSLDPLFFRDLQFSKSPFVRLYEFAGVKMSP